MEEQTGSGFPWTDDDDDLQDSPACFPPSVENMPVRRRAVFSSSIMGLGSYHASLPSDAGKISRRHRRKAHDDSLQLLDDLTNRPMDPLFSDSRLVMQRKMPLWEVWMTRIVVFVICIAVGFFSSLFVQQLHTDPRKAVRQNWATELQGLNSQVDKLNNEVANLQGQVAGQSKQLGDTDQDHAVTVDEMLNGMSKVTGKGIVLTIANPIAADGSSSEGSYHRDGATSQIRVVSDADLQFFVSRLWQSGAEAISVNGFRIGVQTSIRIAGQTIMIGVNPVQSPYRIEAIGDPDALSDGVSAQRQQKFYDSLSAAGIYPQVSKTRSLTLEAASVGNLSYVRKDE